MEKKKIMHIDDEEDFLRLVKLNLEKTDKYEVLSLSSAKDIISQIDSFKPNVILLDLLMPEVNGINVCEILNDDPFNKGIPIIVISGLEKRMDKLKAFKKGVAAYLTKPVPVNKLVYAIEEVLRFKDELQDKSDI